MLTRKTDLSIDKLTVKNAKRKKLYFLKQQVTEKSKIASRISSTAQIPEIIQLAKKQRFLLSVRLLSKMKRVNQTHSLKFLTTWPFEK
jgi:hypothetical protein